MAEYPVPTGVPTAVTLPELALLQHFANRAGDALEIGTLYGFTCIGMALAGADVTSVDPHFEGPADQPDTWFQFQANLARRGFKRAPVHRSEDGFADAYWTGPDALSGDVVAWHGAVEHVFLHQHYRRWGLVFIDGNHTWPCPMRDAEIALAHMGTPGYLAFHDVTPRWPGVWRATRELQAMGRTKLIERVGTLAVYQDMRYQKSASGTSGTSMSPTAALNCTDVSPEPPIST